MKKFKIILFTGIALTFSSTLSAQTEYGARGISMPGRLELEIKKIKSKNEMICTANYQDINDDGILSRDETIDIQIFVRNYSQVAAIQPKIEMIKRIARNQPPEMNLISLTQINPGEMGIHKEPIVWNSNIMTSILVLRIRAIDSLSGFKTDWLEITVQIDNPLKTEDVKLKDEN